MSAHVNAVPPLEFSHAYLAAAQQRAELTAPHVNPGAAPLMHQGHHHRTEMQRRLSSSTAAVLCQWEKHRRALLETHAMQFTRAVRRFFSASPVPPPGELAPSLWHEICLRAQQQQRVASQGLRQLPLPQPPTADSSTAVASTGTQQLSALAGGSRPQPVPPPSAVPPLLRVGGTMARHNNNNNNNNNKTSNGSGEAALGDGEWPTPTPSRPDNMMGAAAGDQEDASFAAADAVLSEMSRLRANKSWPHQLLQQQPPPTATNAGATAAAPVVTAALLPQPRSEPDVVMRAVATPPHPGKAASDTCSQQQQQQGSSPGPLTLERARMDRRMRLQNAASASIPTTKAETPKVEERAGSAEEELRERVRLLEGLLASKLQADIIHSSS